MTHGGKDKLRMEDMLLKEPPPEVRFWGNTLVMMLVVFCSFGSAAYIAWEAWNSTEWLVRGVCAPLVLTNILAGAVVASHVARKAFGRRDVTRCGITEKSGSS